MTIQHTLELWHVGMKPGPIVYGANGVQIADCRIATNTREENSHNARLIALTPELLDVCKKTLDLLELLSPDSMTGTKLALSKVIAKAGAII